MTERERWIVYPLLFLALGVALRDKFVDRAFTKHIACEELEIVADEPGEGESQTPLARLGRNPSNEKAALFEINGDVVAFGSVTGDFGPLQLVIPGVIPHTITLPRATPNAPAPGNNSKPPTKQSPAKSQ